MIQEDYVNFECAKLLKEKLFDIESIKSWYCEYDSANTTHKFNEHEYPLITLQMAMKWLREVHNWHISITRGPQGYHISIITVPLGVVKVITVEITGNRYVESYEEAAQAAIMYCLNNLI